jgi:hypothetical protein
MTNSTIDNFKKNGYTVVRSVISSELRDFITQYALFDEMQDFSPDGYQVPKAHSKYADPAMESLLLILQEKMEECTGLKLFPTYSFYRVYRGGDILSVHKDRPSCEISATLCFNYSYNDSKYQWPIFIGEEGTSVNLSPGDMLIYRGCDLPHWRNQFEVDENTWHVQGFFHYVDKTGPYMDWKYDKRSTVGEIKRREPQTNKKSYIQFTNEN